MGQLAGAAHHLANASADRAHGGPERVQALSER